MILRGSDRRIIILYVYRMSCIDMCVLQASVDLA
jgi:hypothetical protein